MPTNDITGFGPSENPVDAANALAIAQILTGGDPNLGITNLQFGGNNQQIGLFKDGIDLGHPALFAWSGGVILSSGDATPPNSNTTTGFGVDHGGGATFRTQDLSFTRYSDVTLAKDEAFLEFEITADPSLFGSESVLRYELPLYMLFEEPPTNTPDFISILDQNRTQLANFNVGQTSEPAGVTPGTLAAGLFIPNDVSNPIPLEYDFFSVELVVPITLYAEALRPSFGPNHNRFSFSVADFSDGFTDNGLVIGPLQEEDRAFFGITAVHDGGPGDDTLTGTDAADSIVGLGGNDMLFGRDGRDDLRGGIGNDYLTGGPLGDRLTGGPGNDKFVDILPNFQLDRITDFSEGDSIVVNNWDPSYSIQFAHSADGSTTFLDFINGTADIFVDLDGNLPFSTFNIAFDTNQQTATINYSQILQTNFDGTPGNDTIDANDSDNTVRGLGGDDTLNGKGGNDHLLGGDGNDTINGGPGSDVMNGGPGNDTFIGTLTELHQNIIEDFSKDDTLVLCEFKSTYTISVSSGYDEDEGIDVTTVGIDTDGDGNADIHIDLDGKFAPNQFVTSFDAASEKMTLTLDPNVPSPLPTQDPPRILIGTPAVDIFKGTPEEMNGATIQDFDPFHPDGVQLLGVDSFFDVFFDIKIGDTTANMDLNGDGIAEGSFTLFGDFTNGVWQGVFDAANSLFNITFKSNEIRGTENDDDLTGGPEDNQIFGFGGNDKLSGGDGFDYLEGGAGNDSLFGGPAPDTLVGGPGIDTYHGTLDEMNGDIIDKLEAGECIVIQMPHDNFIINIDSFEPKDTKADEITFDLNSDGTIDASIQIDREVKHSNYEVIYDVHHNVLTIKFHGDDGIILGTNNAETIQGDTRSTQIFGLDGDDEIYGKDGDDTIDGGPGDDRINGGSSFSGNELTGGTGSDTFFGTLDELRNTSIHDFTAEDCIELNGIKPGFKVSFTDLSDAQDPARSSVDIDTDGDGIADGSIFIETATLTDKNTTVVYDASTETLKIKLLPGDGNFTGTAGDDVIEGDARDNSINGLGGDDSLEGGDGDDILNGGSGKDKLNGGPGADLMSGGSGADIFYGTPADFDTDVLTNFDDTDCIEILEVKPGHDLKFTDVTHPDGSKSTIVSLDADGDGTNDATFGIEFELNEQNSIITYDAGFESLKITPLQGDGNFTGTEFDDHLGGDKRDNIIKGLGDDDILEGKEGNDTLEGGEGSDSLYGGLGTDTLIGGKGDDKFIGTKAELSGDTIKDIQVGDMIILCDIGPGVVFTVNPHSNGTTTLEFDDNFDDKPDFSITLDGSFHPGDFSRTFDAENRKLEIALIPDDVIGTEFSDTLTGHDRDNQIFGGDGDDTINGKGGADTLFGGKGADTFIGTASDLNLDKIWDFNEGDKVVICPDDNATGPISVLAPKFTDGRPVDIFIDSNGDGNFESSFSLGHVVLFGPNLSDKEDIEIVVETDSKTGKVTIRYDFPIKEIKGELAIDDNTASTTPKKGTVAPDSDVTLGSKGEDSISGDSRDNVVDGGDGRDNLSGNDGDDYMRGGQGKDTLKGDAGKDKLDGGDDADFLFGGDDADELIGGRGNDVLRGEGGADTHVLFDGDGHDRIIDFDPLEDILNLSLVSAFDSFADVMAAAKDTSSGGYVSYNGGSIKTLGISIAQWHESNFSFDASGTPFSAQGPGGDLVIGTLGRDGLNGLSGGEVLFGRPGNDALYGDVGNDRLFGDDGIDLLSGGPGDDILDGGPGNDRIFSGTGNDVIIARNDDGADRVFEFESGFDSVDVSGTGFASGADAHAALIPSSNGALLPLMGGRLQFIGLEQADLLPSDFIVN